jgi:hypothetical protein
MKFVYAMKKQIAMYSEFASALKKQFETKFASALKKRIATAN